MIEMDNLLQNALIALAAGRHETARRLLTSLIATDPKNERAWLYLAAALPREQAIQALQKVLILNPGHKKALQGLRRLRQNPIALLDLADVLIEETEDQAIFGDEPATIPASSVFLNDPPTMPVAFRNMLKQPNTMTEDQSRPEPSLISSLLAEEWTAHPLPKIKPVPMIKPVEPLPEPEMEKVVPEAPQPTKSLALRTEDIPAATPTPKTYSSTGGQRPLASLTVDPYSIEAHAARATQPRVTRLEQPARRVREVPHYNINMPLPIDRPSSNRRSYRMPRSQTGLTSLGYLVVLILLVIIALYLFGAFQQNIGVYP
jgi:hypothetical protein